MQNKASIKLLLPFLLCIICMLLSSLSFALPKNFRNVDIFYVGAMPSGEDIDELQLLGIKTIISLHKLPPEVQKKAQRKGINTHSHPLRTRLINIEQIMEIIASSPPNTVYIHCLHGADRTGAVTAYWLTTKRSMDPISALAMVISPSEFHIRGLNMLAHEYALCLAPYPKEVIGRYSGAKNGGLEGLKICGDQWYTKLARNFLTITMGPPYMQPKQKFWNKYNRMNEK